MHHENKLATGHTVFGPFWFGDVVYLRVRETANPGMITGVLVRPGPSVQYGVTWSDGHECYHYAEELTHERPL